MIEDAAMPATKKESLGRVSVALPPDLHAEIGDRAEQNDISLNRVIIQLLRAGLEAERQKKQRLEEMLLRYRESTDPQEVERLGDELGAIIFGR
jgi:metal-responsive CopG/Arc/MetJ family transcriptional regulator